ncbi:MAG: hypothetical protein HY762_09690 [Planctomycetes bacterium]|nr:hypothetical protein [Planctomycetota bacterium]
MSKGGEEMDGLFNIEEISREFLDYIDNGMKGAQKMFDQQEMAQTVFKLAKDYTNTTMQMMKTSAEQYEKTLDALMKQGLVMQTEGQKLMTDWINRAKQAQSQYWDQMEDGLKKMETAFGKKPGK